MRNKLTIKYIILGHLIQIFNLQNLKLNAFTLYK